MPAALMVCRPPEDSCVEVLSAAMLTIPVALMVIAPLPVRAVSTRLMAFDVADGVPAVPFKVIVPRFAVTVPDEAVVNGWTAMPLALPPLCVVPPTPVMESVPLLSAWTRAESDTPMPPAEPAPRFVPPLPVSAIAPLVSMCVCWPMATPVTELVPVAFDVPPVPPIEMAPPFEDSIRLAAPLTNPRACPVADVPPVPVM